MTETRPISFSRNNFVEEESGAVADTTTPPEQAPSPQQAMAEQWVLRNRGNALIRAVAGSGKTTTLLNCLKHMAGYISIVCYNKPVQLEIEEKVRARGFGSNVQVGTFHSFGLRNWRRIAPQVKIEGLDEKSAGYYKMDRIFDIMDGHEKMEGWTTTPVPPEYRAFVRKLMGLGKQYAIGAMPQHSIEDQTEWTSLVDHFDLDDMFVKEGYGYNHDEVSTMVNEGIELTKEALCISNAIAREVIDFDDMVYLPLFQNHRVFQVNWLLVDEAQDLNRARRYLAAKMVNPWHGRAIFVGDDRQAIYGFSGADAESFDRIRKEFRCTELPLTYTFRCPKKVVELAHTWVKHIESAPESPDGEVSTVTLPQLLQMSLRDTDAILCRNNAPLVSLAFVLIRKGIGCYVEGRDIGKNVMDLASKWNVVRLSALMDKIKAYKAREVSKLLREKRDVQAEQMAEKADTLIALIQGMPKEATVHDLHVRIESMFKDSKDVRRKVLVLSSIHKAKGKEWKRVFLLGRNAYMPSPYARQDWHKVQEANLCYVAVTRAMETLVEVTVPTRDSLKRPNEVPLDQLLEEQKQRIVDRHGYSDPEMDEEVEG